MQFPTYLIRRASHPPALDADFDSPDWSPADVVEIKQYHEMSSSHRPRVQAKVVFDEHALYVHFRVFDRYVRCVETQDQGTVYLDSCAEFFVQPGEDPAAPYLNFEMNSGGALLLFLVIRPPRGAKQPFEAHEVVSPKWMARIKRFHTLPKVVDPEMAEPVTWRVAYSVPMALFEHYCGPLQPIERRTWRGNFFKCADATSHPHWGMWSPVEVLTFHQPLRFGTLRFEAPK